MRKRETFLLAARKSNTKISGSSKCFIYKDEREKAWQVMAHPLVALFRALLHSSSVPPTARVAQCFPPPSLRCSSLVPQEKSCFGWLHSSHAAGHGDLLVAYTNKHSTSGFRRSPHTSSSSSSSPSSSSSTKLASEAIAVRVTALPFDQHVIDLSSNARSGGENWWLEWFTAVNDICQDSLSTRQLDQDVCP